VTKEADERYMRRCFQLAANGLGMVAPNPLVGAVIVHKDRIIGEGYHRKYGEAHAEVNAVNSVADKSLLPDATIYVSLEPCAHFGKTPPCADLLVKHRFKRVVIANRDPFDAVDGKGIERLIANGIDVEVGVLEQEGRELNRRFFTFHEQKRPYIILKWAQSKDGFMGRENESVWITAPETRKLVHLWRSQEMGILVGRQTVRVDDPELTVRDVAGNQPTRIIIDRDLQLPTKSRVFNDAAPFLVLNEVDANDTRVKIDFGNFFPEVMSALHQHNIASLIVEGGAVTLQRFLDADLFDELRVLTGNVYLKTGIAAPAVRGEHQSCTTFGADLIDIYRP
jgi:diaminohydroxyphosphoribosylaminopyrimidine deaminase / 5-amino-6-(5-phosphoribosylamino)uracil reductase